MGTTVAAGDLNPSPTHKACTLCDDDSTPPPTPTPAPPVFPMLAQPSGLVHAVMFWMDSCPHCHEVIDQALPPLQEKYGDRLDIRLIELKTTQDIDQLYQIAAALNIPKQNVSVPLLIIGNQALVGSAQIPAELPGLIERHLAAGGVDFPRLAGLQGLVPTTTLGLEGCAPATPCAAGTVAPTTAPATQVKPDVPPAPVQPAPTPERHLLDLPLLGAVDLDAHSLVFSTAIIGFVDGINPCSLWVLSLLLAMIVYSGSRKRTLVIGLTYLAVAAGLYGLIIVGLFGVFAFVAYADWIRFAVALIAFAFAVVNIKDYFWFKEGLSLTISDRHKPKIYRDIRGLMSPDKSAMALVGATAAMAGGITLVEMPCTAGLPILWTKLIATHNVGPMEFGLLLGLYLLLYLIDELIVFVSVVVTLKASKLEEKQGRVLKLVGGIIMLTLAAVLLVNPSLMDSVRSSALVFGAAFAASLLVLVVHRKVLPRYGILVGTHMSGADSSKRGP